MYMLYVRIALTVWLSISRERQRQISVSHDNWRKRWVSADHYAIVQGRRVGETMNDVLKERSWRATLNVGRSTNALSGMRRWRAKSQKHNESFKINRLWHLAPNDGFLVFALHATQSFNCVPRGSWISVGYGTENPRVSRLHAGQ